MNKFTFTKKRTLHQLLLLVLLGLLLSACGSNFGASPTPIPLPAVGGSSNSSTGEASSQDVETSSETSGDTNADTTDEPTEAASGSPALVPTATPEAEDATDTTAETSAETQAETSGESTNAQPATGSGSSPFQLDIERIRLSVSITPMDWRITRINDQRTTEWIIPEESAGWHPDSAPAGAAGNVIISGYQNVGNAVFSQLALGNVQVDQEILLTATDGSVYKYIVTEVGTPIPLDGTSAAELDRMAEYYAPSDDAVLTLVTGWPAFTTTHRMFIVATLAGE